MLDRKLKNELDVDFQLLGVASSLKEYKFGYHLSQFLDLDFRKLADLVFEPADRTRKISFSVFRAREESDKNLFTVFTNKNLDEVLLPEVANFDYIIQISGKYDQDDMKNLISGIKHFPEVVMTAEIPVKRIKNKERLVYQEERPSNRLISAKRLK